MAIVFGNRGGRRRRSGGGRLLIALVIAGVALGGYFLRSSINPVTGQKERVALTVEDEVAIGLQAAPEMAAQHGGLLEDPEAQARVDRVGAAIVGALPRVFPEGENPYPFEFHVLADPDTVNAFALPGGQVFITAALLNRLETEGQLAGVLAHEVGHVIERHSAERLAEMGLMQGLVGAVTVGAYDPERPGASAAAGAAAQVIAQLTTMKYGRDDELESDRYGVALTAAAGYDPRAMIRVMQILAESSGGGGQPEFMSTHPDPGNRIGRIEESIREKWPQGVPEGLRE